MGALVHADIFFLITTIAVVMVTIISCIVGFYVILIVRNVWYITEKARAVADEVEEDVEFIKDTVTLQVVRIEKGIHSILDKIFGEKKKKEKEKKPIVVK
jgi:hypothetical protein